MKEFLSRGGHEFTVRQVDEDESAYNELTALGYRAVPVTMIGTEAVKGYDPIALQAALDRAR